MNFRGLSQVVPCDSALLLGSCCLHNQVIYPGHTAGLGLGSLPCGIQAMIVFIARAGLSDSFIIIFKFKFKTPYCFSFCSPVCIL